MAFASTAQQSLVLQHDSLEGEFVFEVGDRIRLQLDSKPGKWHKGHIQAISADQLTVDGIVYAIPHIAKIGPHKGDRKFLKTLAVPVFATSNVFSILGLVNFNRGVFNAVPTDNPDINKRVIFIVGGTLEILTGLVLKLVAAVPYLGNKPAFDLSVWRLEVR